MNQPMNPAIPYKCLFLLSHPTQYVAPFIKQLALQPQIDLVTYYCSDEGVKLFKDPEFGKEVKWDIPLLEGYRYEFLKNHSRCPTALKAPFGLINFGIVGKILKNDFDVVIIHGWHYVTHLLAIFAVTFFSKAKLFLRCENPLNQELLKPAWKRSLKKIFFSVIKHRAFFLAIGSENQKFYEWMGVDSSRIIIMPYSVDNERWKTSYADLKDKKQELRKQLGIPQDKVVILFSGKLTSKKRPLDLLKAFAQISSSNKYLVFVGDGEQAKMLKEYADKHRIDSVFFAGFKNQTELPEFYAAADIFVLPSGIGETWGLVINEAMCFQLPIIVSDMPGAGKDLVSDGANGFTYSVGNIEALSQKLGLLIRDKSLREKMGIKSFDRISGWNYKNGITALFKFFSQTVKK